VIIDLQAKYKPFKQQFLAHIAPYQIVLYGGAMWSGKTRWLCADIIWRAWNFPGSQGAIIRRNLPSLKRSTWRTFLQLVDDRMIKRMNQQDNYVEFKNGSIIFFMEANEQKDPEFYKFGGVELTFFGIDEAQEVAEKALLMLLPKLRHLPRGFKHIEDLPPNLRRVDLTANPAPGWLKEKFVDRNGKDPNSIYIPARVFDNPYKPKNAIETLRSQFGGNEALFKRMVLGDWNAVNEEDVWLLIDPTWVEDAIVEDDNEGIYTNENLPIYLGVDVARVKDKLVIAKVKERRLIGFETYKNVRIPDIVNLLEQKIKKEGIAPENIVIDAIGVGAGVVDDLQSKGYDVKPFMAGQKPFKNDEIINEMGGEFVEFANLRAQAYWLVRKLFQNGMIEISNSIEDLELFKNELLSIRYKLQAERVIQIETKDKIRQKLGRSPDYADAFVMAIFAKHLAGQLNRIIWV
jgi:hypothetical protein